MKETDKLKDAVSQYKKQTAEIDDLVKKAGSQTQENRKALRETLRHYQTPRP